MSAVVEHVEVAGPDVPDGTVRYYGELPLERAGDRWVPVPGRRYCPGLITLDGVKFKCQGHRGGAAAHLALVPEGVLRWWTFGTSNRVDLDEDPQWETPQGELRSTGRKAAV